MWQALAEHWLGLRDGDTAPPGENRARHPDQATPPTAGLSLHRRFGPSPTQPSPDQGASSITRSNRPVLCAVAQLPAPTCSARRKHGPVRNERTRSRAQAPELSEVPFLRTANRWCVRAPFPGQDGDRQKREPDAARSQILFWLSDSRTASSTVLPTSGVHGENPGSTRRP